MISGGVVLFRAKEGIYFESIGFFLVLTASAMGGLRWVLTQVCLRLKLIFSYSQMFVAFFFFRCCYFLSPVFYFLVPTSLLPLTPLITFSRLSTLPQSVECKLLRLFVDTVDHPRRSCTGTAPNSNIPLTRSTTLPPAWVSPYCRLRLLLRGPV